MHGPWPTQWPSPSPQWPSPSPIGPRNDPWTNVLRVSKQADRGTYHWMYMYICMFLSTNIMLCAHFGLLRWTYDYIIFFSCTTILLLFIHIPNFQNLGEWRSRKKSIKLFRWCILHDSKFILSLNSLCITFWSSNKLIEDSCGLRLKLICFLGVWQIFHFLFVSFLLLPDQCAEIIPCIVQKGDHFVHVFYSPLCYNIHGRLYAIWFLVSLHIGWFVLLFCIKDLSLGEV